MSSDNGNTAIPPSRRKVHAATPQMSVLGRDGRDLDRGHHLTQSASMDEQEEPTAKKSWFGNWKIGKSHDDDDDVASYASMGDSSNNTNTREPSPVAGVPKKIASVMRRPLSAVTSRAVAFTSVATTEEEETPAKEEAVRKDCSFFYQDMEEAAAVTASDDSYMAQGDSASDSNPRYRAAYRARFQQLNDDTGEEFRHHNDDDGEHDLLFYDEEASVATPAPNVLDVAHSSLCWSQDGRILMKLPKDKVRLIMDPHLEPGILSVEQQRYHRVAKQKDDSSDDLGDALGATDAPLDPEEIMYVLTVDDHLYRRVVGEMSGALSSRFRVHQFCIEEGRVDISVAVFLLVIVLIILFINTIIWPIGE